MEKKWHSEILYLGQSGRGFKLGLNLSLGYFWCRNRGCSVLYMGSEKSDTDFENVVATADSQAGTIRVPKYVNFFGGRKYFFAVRNVNGAGIEEKSLSAVLRVTLDSFSNICPAEPNGIFEIHSKQVEVNRVRLGWFYNPRGQGSEPAVFKVYYGRQGDSVNYCYALAEIRYSGNMYYEYVTDILENGRHFFDIRAVDTDGVQSNCCAAVSFEIASKSGESVSILKAEVI